MKLTMTISLPHEGQVSGTTSYTLCIMAALCAAYIFRAYRFLTAVGIHFWTDIVWHVGWGALV